MTTVDDIIAQLGLEPHPEGGFYREVYRHRPSAGVRGTLAVINFLLPAGQRSAWHRIDVSEVWSFHAGAPLRLTLSHDGSTVRHHLLGLGLDADERPQAVVEPGCWMTAATLGSWTLVGCTTVPAFEFAGFEMAPEGWEPGGTAP